MSLKNAALTGLIGMVALTALLVLDLVFNISNLLSGLVPAVSVFRSLVYAFAGFCVTRFFFVFYKAQA